MQNEKVKFVRLPTGGRIEIELDDEQVQIFVKEEIKRQISEYIKTFIPIYRVQEIVREQTKSLINDVFELVITKSIAETPHEYVGRAVAFWLESRQGWVAKQLRRGKGDDKEMLR